MQEQRGDDEHEQPSGRERSGETECCQQRAGDDAGD
jgi:hypothetical protein